MVLRPSFSLIYQKMLLKLYAKENFKLDFKWIPKEIFEEILNLLDAFDCDYWVVL